MLPDSHCFTKISLNLSLNPLPQAIQQTKGHCRALAEHGGTSLETFFDNFGLIVIIL